MKYVGLVADHTVLKYPHFPGQLDTLNIEAEILQALESHPRVVEFKGRSASGILLGFARNGSIASYLRHTKPTIQERLNWSRQAAAALVYLHRKRFIHCDINVNNLLLDEELSFKLCDFQGRLLPTNGNIVFKGGASENIKSFMPRSDPEHADHKTDIFALGSAIYHIVKGHEPFPELDPFEDELQIVCTTVPIAPISCFRIRPGWGNRP